MHLFAPPSRHADVALKEYRWLESRQAKNDARWPMVAKLRQEVADATAARNRAGDEEAAAAQAKLDAAGWAQIRYIRELVARGQS